MAKARPRITPTAQQALYAGLAQMLRAGLPADRALKSFSASGNKSLATGAELAARAVAGGQPLARALRDAGLLPAADRTLIENAERSGRIDAALEACGRRLQTRIEQNRRLRTRLIAPAAILVAACLLTPLPAVVGGEISLSGYALRALAPLLVIALLVIIARALFARASTGAALESLPLLGGLIRRRRKLDTLESLQLHLASGAAAIDALADLARSAPAGAARAGCRTAHELAANGSSVASALDAGGFLSKREGVPIVSAGEHAGQLDTALGRYLKTLREAQSSREDTLAQWLPRGIYFAAMAFTAWSLLGG